MLLSLSSTVWLAISPNTLCTLKVSMICLVIPSGKVSILSTHVCWAQVSRFHNNPPQTIFSTPLPTRAELFISSSCFPKHIFYSSYWFIVFTPCLNFELCVSIDYTLFPWVSSEPSRVPRTCYKIKLDFWRARYTECHVSVGNLKPARWGQRGYWGWFKYMENLIYKIKRPLCPFFPFQE